MIEAEITCECLSILLSDMQLQMTQGMVVYYDATRARNSVDLARAVRAKAVTIKYVQRYREQRPAPVVPATPATRRTPEPEVTTPDPVIAPVVDEDAVARKVAALLEPRLAAILAAIQTQGPGVPQSSVPGKPAGTMVKDDVPVFIPSKIGRDDLRPNLAVAVEGSDQEGGVADALAALKAARKVAK